MACIVNPDLCPKDKISARCQQAIQDKCVNDKHEPNKFAHCLKTNQTELLQAGCSNLNNLPNCFFCNLWANISDSDLTSVCAISGFSKKDCENAEFGQAFDTPLNCCKWNLPPPPPGFFSGGKKIAGILGGLLFMIITGLIIWIVVRKKSKKGGKRS